MVARTPMAIARRRYSTQVRGARERGIAWKFTFETWWDVWQRSGRWAQRGPGAGQYVMSRPGDVGDYSPENVKIVLSEENTWESIETRLRGVVRGWRYRPDCSKSKPYQVYLSQKYVGVYATPEEASAAYRDAANRLRRAA